MSFTRIIRDPPSPIFKPRVRKPIPPDVPEPIEQDPFDLTRPFNNPTPPGATGAPFRLPTRSASGRSDDGDTSTARPTGIPGLNLPRPNARSTPIPRNPTGLEGSADPFDANDQSSIGRIPRSLKDLLSFTYLPPADPEAIIAGAGRLGPNAFTDMARRFQRDSVTSSFGGGTTVMPEKKKEVVVDELKCEWCWRCGRERARGEVGLLEMGQMGMQWVCKDSAGCARAADQAQGVEEGKDEDSREGTASEGTEEGEEDEEEGVVGDEGEEEQAETAVRLNVADWGNGLRRVSDGDGGSVPLKTPTPGDL